MGIFVNCIYLVCIVVILCVFVVSYVYLLYVLCVYCCSYLVAGLLARSQYPEGPATGHLDTGFSWLPCVYKRMLRWFPSFQVATTCLSCSPPDLNFLVTFFPPYFTISVQLVQRIPCQGSSGWAWRLQHRRANYSNCDNTQMTLY